MAELVKPSELGYSLFSHQTKTQALSAPTYIDVGMQADSGFRAAALSFIDALYTPFSLDDTVINRVLEAYFKYYPGLLPKTALLTPQNRLKEVFKAIDISDAVATLAFVFRQITVDAIQADPGRYVLALIQSHSIISLRELRQPGTPINAVVFAALARALTLPVRLSLTVLSAGKELPEQRLYDGKLEELKRPVLTIGFDGQCYWGFGSRERFGQLRHETRHYPVHLPEQDTMTLTEAQARIVQYEQRILLTFDAVLKILSSAHQADNLGCAELLSIYIQTIAIDVQEINALVVGAEVRNQAYFNDLMRRAGRVPADYSQCQTHDQRLAWGLCQAIARVVALGIISEEQLSDLMDSVERPKAKF